MTNEQANELLSHLTGELEANGFGEVVRQIRIRLEESFETAEAIQFSRRGQLKFYLSSCIDILDSLSSAHARPAIASINEYTLNEAPIQNAVVTLLDERSVDLLNLPDYTSLIAGLENIFAELSNE